MRFIIPSIEDTDWKTLNNKELKKTALKHFKEHLAGKQVYNRDKGIYIILAVSGATHTAWARKTGYEKLVVFKGLREVIENGKFVNWQNPKSTHSKSTIGFMRFSSLVYINGIKRRFIFDVRIDKGGKFYYDHNVFVKS